MRRFAPAKINLGLRVLQRRNDGYHDIETVFLRVDWCDEVAVSPAPQLLLTCSDPSLPTDASNLCVSAAMRLASRGGVDRGANICLHKHLPFGAGLGGGSSDAAATLGLLRELWDVPIGEDDLHEVAAELGADVPFFLTRGPQLGTGRGDVLQPLVDASGEVYRFPFRLVIAVPGIHVSTAEAYGGIAADVLGSEKHGMALSEIVLQNDPVLWRQHLRNQFEVTVFQRHPTIAALKSRMYELGAGYAAMSGSGSAVFGVFEDAASSSAAAAALGHHPIRVWEGGTYSG